MAIDDFIRPHHFTLTRAKAWWAFDQKGSVGMNMTWPILATAGYEGAIDRFTWKAYANEGSNIPGSRVLVSPKRADQASGEAGCQ